MYRNGVAIHGRRDNLFTMENKMTPAQRAHRDKLAEPYDIVGPNGWIPGNVFKNGYDAAHAEAEVLVKALERAIEVMEFAYMNLPAQPKEISEARKALKAWRRE